MCRQGCPQNWRATSGQILLAAHKPVEKVVQTLLQDGRQGFVLPLGLLAKAQLKRQHGSLPPEPHARGVPYPCWHRSAFKSRELNQDDSDSARAEACVGSPSSDSASTPSPPN